MTTLQYARATTTARPAPLQGIGAWIRTLVQRMRAARARREQGLELAAMSDHELSDLGIGRCEVPALLAREPLAQREVWVTGVM